MLKEGVTLTRTIRQVAVTAAATALTLLPAAVLPAQEVGEASGTGSWIHIRVDEADGGRVALNLPMSLVDEAFGMLEREGIGEELELDPGSGIDLDDFRTIWREMRDAGDVEFVRVEDDGGRVRIRREGERVHVHVDEDGRETIRVDVPASLVDVLLGAEGDRLNVRAAARELARSGEHEVIRIDDEKTRVRVWVDDRSSGA